jgi:hypothetical protein
MGALEQPRKTAKQISEAQVRMISPIAVGYARADVAIQTCRWRVAPFIGALSPFPAFGQGCEALRRERYREKAWRESK